MHLTRKIILQQSVGELVVLNRQLYETLKWQVEMFGAKSGDEGNALLVSIKQIVIAHACELERLFDCLSSDCFELASEATPTVLVVQAKPFCESERKSLSNMLRDDYIALSSMTVAYTILHTTGMAFYDSLSAIMALSHLKTITPLLTQINKMMPMLISQELCLDAPDADPNVAAQASLNTQKAWAPSHLLRKMNLFGKSSPHPAYQC